jgi:hypothetical protein
MPVSQTNFAARTRRLAVSLHSGQVIGCAVCVGFVAFTGSMTTAPLMAQTVIVNQQGATNPSSNGFATDSGVTSQGPVGTTAWNVQGSACCGYDYYSLSSGQLTALTTAANWAFIATYQNLSPDTGPGFAGFDTYGSYAIVQFNGVRFDLLMHSDGKGNQVLSVDSYAGTPDYTIAGLGTNFVTLDVLYTNSTKTANIFVNGTKVISNYAGYPPNCSGLTNSISWLLAVRMAPLARWSWKLTPRLLPLARPFRSSRSLYSAGAGTQRCILLTPTLARFLFP